MAARRQLTDQEKDEVLNIHGRHCFIDGHPIGEDEELEFDHIKPVAAGGPTTVENLAPVCKRHNRQKSTMALSEYRDYLELGRLFENGAVQLLDDIISAKGHSVGEALRYDIGSDDKSVSVYTDAGKTEFSLYTCPATSWRYFYALIPVQHLKNDEDLQPRPLRQKSMWGLYRHFQRNTQLAPSICRLEADGSLLLFDGQHKAAAQIWAGRNSVECKIYIQPAAKALKETNLEAHLSYRQMAFYSYELMKKYADIFGEDWDEYSGLEGPMSEQGFVNFLVNVKKMTKAKARSEVELAIHRRILDDPKNLLKPFVSKETRSRLQPLTYNRLARTFFRHLLSPIPSEAEFESDKDLRALEEQNLVRVMSIVAEEMLMERWDPDKGDAIHKRTQRIVSAGSVRAWVRVLRDVLNAYLQLYLQGPDEIERVLYRELTDEQFGWIRKFIQQIAAHSVWDAPNTSDQDISKTLTKDDDTTAMSLLQERGLVVQWVLEGAGTG